jgi:hypothetical protein
MKAFIFILVFVFPDGQMDIKHTVVPKCPSAESVNETMKPLVDSKQILLWGGSCTPLFKDAIEA